MLVPQGSTSTWMLTNKCMNTDSIIELSKQIVLKKKIKCYSLSALLSISILMCLGMNLVDNTM